MTRAQPGEFIMKVKQQIVLAALLFLFAASAHAQAANVASTLTSTIQPGALMQLLNPSSATEACNVPGGTVVSTVSVSGGDGNPITLSMTGNTTDFVLSATTPPANVVVAPGGVILADCNKSYTNTITATQP